ncbi:MAG: EAL domain-containing protein [Pirellulales bacterium]|nr:EAL domain-containing protein [Pirellulales bacterium]
MSAQVTREPAVDLPWLEHYGFQGGMPQKTPLEEFPFTIGRNESSHLQIDSARVSREHAIISREGDQFRIRDLGSTNGTYVNGRQIEEAALADGDVLLIANVEFGFFCRSDQTARSTVTQVMDVDRPRPNHEHLAQGIIRAVRRLQETTVQRSFHTLFQPVVSLSGGQPAGYEALSEGGGQEPSEAERIVLSTECHLTGRLRRLRRLLAAEEAGGLPHGVGLFVSIDSSEMGSQRLLESLAKLRDILRGGRRLVVALPDSAASDVPLCREFRSRLQGLGIGIAYDDFSAGGGQLLQQTETVPDFVKLNQSLVRDLDDNPEHQRQIQSVVSAGREIGCEIIAAGIRRAEEAEICRMLGCRFGQGDLFGPPRPADSLLDSADTAAPLQYSTTA